MKNKKVHTFCDDVLGDLDATAVAKMIREKSVSSSEFTEAAIERAVKVKDILNPIAYEAFEQAIKDSRKHPTGLFAGVPTFVKDNSEVKGMPMRNGSEASTSKPDKKNGPFVGQFLKMGFTVLGKSRLPEFGFTATTEYANQEPCRNPWHTDYSTGGSSGGSAAMVAAGVVPIAHGNDGGGSIRIPAACCGLVGLKSTRGRFIENFSGRALPVKIISDGVLTRSVRDTARFFSAMEWVWQNKKLPPVGNITGPGKKRMRIGLVIDSITGNPTCPETRAVVEETAALLESMGHRVEPMDIQVPDTFIEDFTLYWSMLAFLLKNFGKVLFAPEFDARRFEPFSKGLAEHFRKNIRKAPAAIYRLRQSGEEYTRGISGYDAVLSPVLAHTVPKIGYLDPNTEFYELFRKLTNYVSFTPLNNASGSPAISLPMGSDSKGLPIAVQIQSHHGGERVLLELAYELEEARPFRRIE